MEFRQTLKNIKPYKPGKSAKDMLIKLASNENPYGCSENVQKVLNNFCNISMYPDNYCTELRSKLSKKLNIKESQLVFGNGSVEIITMVAQIVLNPGDEVITGIPSFNSYEISTKLMDAKLIEIPLKNQIFDLEKIFQNINAKTKLIYIANPNNPTGTIVTHDELEEFLSKIPKEILVVLDEAYNEFVTSKEYPNSLKLLEQYKNIIILRTFSKAYGLAGLRIGYGIADENVICELEKVRQPFNVSSIAQAAACEALDDTEFLTTTVKNNTSILENLYIELDKLNIEYVKSQANFILINVKKSGKIVFEELLKRGFIVRPGFLNIDTFIRVTIGTEEQMKNFVKALEDIMRGNAIL